MGKTKANEYIEPKFWAAVDGDEKAFTTLSDFYAVLEQKRAICMCVCRV